MFPTTSGELEWSRYDALDVAGDWSVSIEVSDQVASTDYTLKDLELNDVITVSQGTILTEHPAPGFIIYVFRLGPLIPGSQSPRAPDRYPPALRGVAPN